MVPYVSFAPSPRPPASEPLTFREARDRRLELSGERERRWRAPRRPGRLVVRWGVSGSGEIFEGGKKQCWEEAMLYEKRNSYYTFLILGV
jgi:hypothetical protein